MLSSSRSIALLFLLANWSGRSVHLNVDSQYPVPRQYQNPNLLSFNNIRDYQGHNSTMTDNGEHLRGKHSSTESVSISKARPVYCPGNITIVCGDNEVVRDNFGQDVRSGNNRLRRFLVYPHDSVYRPTDIAHGRSAKDCLHNKEL